MWKWMGLFLRNNNLLRCLVWLSLLNWIGALTWPLLLKLAPRKLEPWFNLWSFFLLRLLYISINLPHGLAWNTVVMLGIVLLVPTCNCCISYKNGPWSFTCCLSWTLDSSSKCSHLKFFLHRYYFGRCPSELAQLVSLPYSWGRSTCYSDRLHDFFVTIDVTRMSMSTVSFLAQLDTGQLDTGILFL